MGAKVTHKRTSRTVKKRAVKKTAAKKSAKLAKKRVTKKTAKKTTQKATESQSGKAAAKSSALKHSSESDRSTYTTSRNTYRRLLAPLVPQVQSIAARVVARSAQTPINTHGFMVATARVGGVSFVVLGGIFTALIATNITVTDSQTAQLLASVSGEEEVERKVPRSELSIKNTATTTILNVSTKAEQAKKVFIYMKDMETGELYPLGASTQTASGAFNFSRALEVISAEKKFNVRADVWYSLERSDLTTEHVGVIEITSYGESNVNEEDQDSHSDTNDALLTSYTPDTEETDESATTSVSSESDQEDEEILPTVKLELSDDSTYNGREELDAKIKTARAVEWYAVPAGSAVKRYLGKSVQVNSDRWRLPLNTHNLPNGVYSIFAEAKTKFGVITSDKAVITIENEIASSSATKLVREEVHKVEREWSAQIEDDSDKNGDFVDHEVVAAAAAPKNEAVTRLSVSERYDERLNILLNRLTVAEQAGDTSRVERLEKTIEEFQDEVATDVSEVEDTEEVKKIAASYIDKRRKEHDKLRERQEQFIKERAKAKVLADTDGDGVSDYDEVTLFSTDPTVADTDADGVIDGVEITDGYDPLDASPRRAVVYESPKERGVERPDVLTIDSFTPVSQTDVVTEETEPSVGEERLVAHVTGRGLPQSFVTLYIYSSPVVVTVKTDEEGNWEYTFDKELEDGEHTVYVGITDNSGQIVAKSAPFRFIKEAQAVTPITQAAIDDGISTNEPSSLTSRSSLLLIAAISVVALGLVLILLGIFLEFRSPRPKRKAAAV